MGVVREIPGAVGEKRASDQFLRVAAQVDEIHQKVMRIEECLGRLPGGANGLGMTPTADVSVVSGLSGPLADVSAALREIRNVQNEASANLGELSADVKRLLQGRSGGLIDGLGPSGQR